MNTAIEVKNGIDNKIELIKRTVAKGATNDELEMFTTLAKKYDLDPFAKEIWFIKYDGKAPSIFTSRDGYLKIAHASGKFDGMESYTIDDEKGNPVKAVAIVYRKDMSRPFKAEIKIAEYKQNSPTWNKYTSAMGIKVAEVFALKRAFSISGLVTQEEMGTKEEIETKEPQTIEAKVEDISGVFEEETLTEEERVGFWKTLKERGYKQNDAIVILHDLGITDSSKMNKSEIPMLLSTHFPVKEVK